jgi:hypothetical protein
LIKAKGVRVERDAKSVQNKIENLEQKFRKAHEFATSVTGAGLETGAPSTFGEAVKKKCPHYFQLLQVMSDRASSKATLSSEGKLKNDNGKTELDSDSDPNTFQTWKSSFLYSNTMLRYYSWLC